MPEIMPLTDSVHSIKNRTIYFFFFKLRIDPTSIGEVKDKLHKNGAICRHWFVCEYALIGSDENLWTHAAIFDFKSSEVAKRAFTKGIISDHIEGIQVFSVKTTNPPFLINFIFKLMRPLGSALTLFSKQNKNPRSSDLTKKRGGVSPTEEQFNQHYQNDRTTKAYMINLLQTYPIAQYPDRKTTVSGGTAYYRRYGLVAMRSVYMIGGRLILAGRMGAPILEYNVPKLTQGAWEGIGVMEYPNPSKIFELEKMPGYKKAYEHRDAGLEKTVLIISKKE